MVLSENEQLNKNALMFIYMRENKDINVKIVNINNILKDGANVNACDRNNNYNTPLHIATQNCEREIVQLLLDNGALLFFNNDGKTPADIAKDNNSAVSKEIAKLLVLKGKHAARTSDCAVEQKKPSEANKNRQNNKGNRQNKQKKSDLLYLKRAGTSGVSGQFYETKLLSLVLLRALHDNDIEYFLLATNIKDIGDFDDVCFRYKLKDQDKDIAIFLQAKHRDDPDKGKLSVPNVKSHSGDFGLAKYFDSFLKIRQKFSSDNPDAMFKGDLNDVKCYFVLYTPLKESFTQQCEINPMCKKMHEFIYTGDNEGTFQYDYDINDVDFLTQFILEERVKSMGLVFLDFILSSKDRHDSMMTNNLIKVFHPALARKVISVSEVKPEGYRLGNFRQEFFESEEDILVTLKETLCKAIVFNYSKKTTLKKEEIQTRIIAILNNPCSQTISTLMGDVITYDEKNVRLCLNESCVPQNLLSKEDIVQIKNDLHKIVVTSAVVKDAIVLAGIRKLDSIQNFKLPATFGNSDLSIRGNEKKITSRINFLATKLIKLINEFKDTKIIDISNETVGPNKFLEYDTLETNGGIGGAVGNLLTLNESIHMLVFNTADHTLPEKAKRLLSHLRDQTSEDLSAYKIKINVEVFPKISFHASQYDKRLAKEFLNKLWFYTGQAKEDGVERILKAEINFHCNSDKNRDQFLFNVHSDAIFLRFHDEIQKWWKSPTKAPYLTKSDKLFDEAKGDIIDSPLLTVLNVMCIRQIKKISLEFKPEAAEAFDLENFTHGFMNVVSDAVILSAAKILQFDKHKNHYIFLNLDYILQLPVNDYKTMMDELKETNISTLVIINELSIEHSEAREKLNNIFTNFCGQKIMIFTEKVLNIESTKWSSGLNYTLNDKWLNISYFTVDSQLKFLNDYEINYQGEEVPLDKVIDESSKHLVGAKVLRTLINKGKIEIGHALSNPKYDQIKDYYMNRPLMYEGEELQVNTLNDINNNVVIIAGKPCIGKTTLLTHLSLETKKIDPRPWIVRINLSHSKDFQKLHEKSMDIRDIFKFLCKAALRNCDELNKIKVINTSDGVTVYIHRTDSDDVSFELELFINFFNNNQTIFLFDGYDRILLHNSNESIQFFKTLNQNNKRLWITTSSYFSKTLENEFGEAYKLQTLSRPQQQSFLHSFWKTNLKLEKLNHDQFNNIICFLKFIFRTFNIEHHIREEDRPIVTLISVPLHIAYVTALEYFKNEICLSPKRIRELFKKKWRLDSFTAVDRHLRTLDDEDQSSELAGTPLHMYVAANYFKTKIEDKFVLDVNTDELTKQLTVFQNWTTAYDRILRGNFREIINLENKDDLGNKQFEKQQDKIRDDFIEKHKKLALYAICRESDIDKFLTKEEISEVKATLQRIESGEEESGVIDCVLDGVPIFYNILFFEYFAVEFASNFAKAALAKDPDLLKYESIWNCLVNGLLLLTPSGVRKAFEYKLKYDPEFVDATSNEKCKTMIFNLILKQHYKENPSCYDPEETVNVAINEGLVNLSNLLVKCITDNATKENVDVFTRVVKSGALALSVVDPSWKEAADSAVESLKDVKNIAESLDKEQIEGISRAVVTLCSNTEVGQKLTETIKTRVTEPFKKFTEKVVEASDNNENLTTLVEHLPQHLPDVVNTVFDLLRHLQK